MLEPFATLSILMHAVSMRSPDAESYDIDKARLEELQTHHVRSLHIITPIVF